MTQLYDYYTAVVKAVGLIGQGHTLSRACDLADVSIVVFEKYVKNDVALQELYLDAERRGHDALADALINIDNDRVHGRSDPKMAKVISDNIKWVLSKRDQKRFGDKIEVKHEITMDRAIVSALENARERVRQIPKGDVIDVEVVDDEAELRAMGF